LDDAKVNAPGGNDKESGGVRQRAKDEKWLLDWGPYITWPDIFFFYKSLLPLAVFFFL
jgi:hypothetical protein